MGWRVRTFWHNCIVHPVAGLCWILGADRLGDRIHGDAGPGVERMNCVGPLLYAIGGLVFLIGAVFQLVIR